MPDGEPRQAFLADLERLLPTVLAVQADGSAEALDGIYPAAVRTVGPGALELLGLALTLEDQALRALHLRMALRPKADALAGLRIRLGTRRTPYDRDRLARMLHELATSADAIDWALDLEVGTPPA